jgi:hypothetical protein
MGEILELEEVWELIKKLYGKKKEGWSAYFRRSKNELFDLLFKGPDVVIEVVQDQLHPFMLENISELPRPWRPLGKGAVLDVDPNLIASATEAYGLRPVSREIFEGLLEISRMIKIGEKEERILRAYEGIVRRHAQTPVISYNEIFSPIISIGPLSYQPNLADISPNQKKLREKLEAEVMKMLRMRRSYII